MAMHPPKLRHCINSSIQTLILPLPAKRGERLCLWLGLYHPLVVIENETKCFLIDILLLQKIYILNKCCSFELFIHQKINFFDTDKKKRSWAPNPNFWMISEGSYDTKWLTKIQLCHYRNDLPFENILKKKTVLNYNISQLYCIFNQISAALIIIRDFF